MSRPASSILILGAIVITGLLALQQRTANMLRDTIGLKMQTEQELLRERQRPGLTPWEPVEVTWYGGTFHGRKDASGGRFSKDLPTCAHPFLPFGTVVVAEGLQGQLVPMIVTDRLPENRLDRLDVSELAARRLGIIWTGRVTLRCAALKLGGLQ